MTASVLREAGAIREDAQILGIGAGVEPTLFWLTNFVSRVFATDLYGAVGWVSDAPTEMLTEPGQFWPGPWRGSRLTVQHMDGRDLQYDDESFDAVFSAGSIEHFGDLDDIARAASEACRVLKPGGVCSLSTEFLVSGRPMAHQDTAVMFTEEMLRRVLIDPV